MKFIRKIKLLKEYELMNTKEGILNEFYEYKKYIGYCNFRKLTLVNTKENNYTKNTINYATELSLLIKLKNKNLIDDEDFFKIKNKIMNEYHVKSELMI